MAYPIYGKEKRVRWEKASPCVAQNLDDQSPVPAGLCGQAAVKNNIDLKSDRYAGHDRLCARRRRRRRRWRSGPVFTKFTAQHCRPVHRFRWTNTNTNSTGSVDKYVSKSSRRRSVLWECVCCLESVQVGWTEFRPAIQQLILLYGLCVSCRPAAPGRVGRARVSQKTTGLSGSPVMPECSCSALAVLWYPLFFSDINVSDDRNGWFCVAYFSSHPGIFSESRFRFTHPLMLLLVIGELFSVVSGSRPLGGGFVIHVRDFLPMLCAPRGVGFRFQWNRWKHSSSISGLLSAFPWSSSFKFEGINKQTAGMVGMIFQGSVLPSKPLFSGIWSGVFGWNIIPTLPAPVDCDRFG